MSDIYKTLLINRPQVLSSGGSGLITQANNLSDVSDVATARNNLSAQPLAAALTAYAGAAGATARRALIGAAATDAQPLRKTWAKIAQIGSGTLAQLKIIVHGDSLGYQKPKFILPVLRAGLGEAGFIQSVTGGLAGIVYGYGSASYNSGIDYTKTPTGDYYTLGASGDGVGIGLGETSSSNYPYGPRITASRGVRQANTVKCYYVNDGTAGTFKLQVSSDGVTWEDVGTTQNAASGTGVYSVTITARSVFRVRALWISGSVKIWALGALSTLVSGLIFADFSRGGVDIAGFAGNGMAGAIINDVAPDLITLESYDLLPGAGNVPGIQALEALYSTLPERVYCGINMWSVVTEAQVDAYNTAIENYCVSSGALYFDTKLRMGTYAQSYAAGWLISGTNDHPNDIANAYCANALFQNMGFKDSPWTADWQEINSYRPVARQARSFAGGIFFDGTSAGRVHVALATGSKPAANPFSVMLTVRLPVDFAGTTNASSNKSWLFGLLGATINHLASSPNMWVQVRTESGLPTLTIGVYDGTNVAYRFFRIPAELLGTDVVLGIHRIGQSVFPSFNGFVAPLLSTSGTQSVFASSLTASYLVLGSLYSGESAANVTIYNAGLFNYDTSAFEAKVLNLALSGGPYGEDFSGVEGTDIASGYIAVGSLYRVQGGTSIVYNSITYPAGAVFRGVVGVSTYTETAGTEAVYRVGCTLWMEFKEGTGTAAYDTTPNSSVGTLVTGANWAKPVAAGLSYSAYASGSAATLTATDAELTFGTTSPIITIAQAGIYILRANFMLAGSNATISSEQVNVKIKRTNNTATDISPRSFRPAAVSAFSRDFGDFTTPDMIYNAGSGDRLALWGNVSAALSAGSVTVTQAVILAVRIG